MKVAALILAHKSKKQLERLILALRHPCVDIYIHLDKKSTLSPADFAQYNVHFTKKRFDITLFDFSMVDAEIELLRTASNQAKYGYYILLSGQCYPLRHIDDIYSYLRKSYPKPLIEIISTELEPMFAHQFRFSYGLKKFRSSSERWINKYIPTKLARLSKYIIKSIFLAAALMKRMFVKSPKQRLKAMGMGSYFESQWWMLPDLAIDEMIGFYENQEFCNCIRDCFSCDETFFQTAMMVHAERFGISLNEKGRYPNKKRFAIFSHSHPVILTEKHFEEMTSSTKLFARKFDIDVDSKILDLLDQHNLDLRNDKIESG